MSEGQSGGNLISRILDALRGLGKRKDDSVLRSKQARPDTIPPVSAAMDAEKLARVSNNRLTPLDETEEPDKGQWQKLKNRAKTTETGDENREHWQSKAQNSILAGTAFDSATTDTGNARRKRPTAMSQARITNHRLQALQASMEKPKNEIDQRDEDDGSVPRGH